MDTVVLAALNTLEASLSNLVISLTTTPTFATAPTAATSLLTADDALTSALTTLKQHQQNYAKILNLRAEATRLEDQIKSIVRTCGELRNEVGAVHPGILDGSSDDEYEATEGTEQQDVDYTTLLSFARRIGRHNTRAARQAEEDAVMRQAEDKERLAAAARQLTNGNTPVAATESTGNVIPENEKAWLNETAAAARAAQGMAFPAAERLRLGMLGQLQLVREQGGEEAVEREIEKLMGKTSESVDENEHAVVSGEPIIESRQGGNEARRQSHALMGGRPQPPPERKKLNLDLWNEDEDDE